MTIELLAVAATSLVAPYLAKAGEAAAGKAGEGAAAAAGKVLGWIRTRLGGDTRDALERVGRNPESDGRKAVLKEELVKALEADPRLAEELRALIPPEALEAASMIQNVSGAGATAVQVSGAGNTTTTTGG